MEKRSKFSLWLHNLFTSKRVLELKKTIANLSRERDEMVAFYTSEICLFQEQMKDLQWLIADLTEITSKPVEIDNYPLLKEGVTLENTIGIREYKGKKGTRFIAYISWRSKDKQYNINIGTYDTIEEAYKARIDYILGLI
jgi:hypothetical protein